MSRIHAKYMYTEPYRKCRTAEARKRRQGSFSKMMNTEGSLGGPVYMEQGQTIPLHDFNAALTELDFQTAQWYRANFGESCRLCVESDASRQFMLTMLAYLMGLQRNGGDVSVPL